MGSLNIPYHNMSVDKSTVEKVYSAIGKKASEKPTTSIDIRSISSDLRFSPAIVKEAFLILQLHGYLKATFLPRCKICDKAVGKDEASVAIIIGKAEKGEYNYCVGCHELISRKEDLEIQLLFWLPKIE